MLSRARWFRAVVWVLLIAVVMSSSVRPASALIRPVGAPSAEPLPLNGLTPSTVAPALLAASDPQRPNLTLTLAVAPDILAAGDTAAITLTVANSSAIAATDLVVTLPVPEGAVALPGPGTISPTQGWLWQHARLEAGGRLTLRGSLRLNQASRAAALLLRAQLAARELEQPIRSFGGALTIDRAPGVASTAFTPGTPALLRSRDGLVAIQTPASLFARPLTLQHRLLPTGPGAPPQVAGFRRGLGMFELEARDSAGQDIHQFAEPLTITVSYTPDQLQIRGISEADLTLFWYDRAAKSWEPIATDIDRVRHTASAVVDHFTPFTLGDGSSPSEAFIPSLQGWQVGLSTGSANYNYSLVLPAGSGGLMPSLALNYSSGTTDGPGGLRLKQQASWVGKGWSLDTGAISLQKVIYGAGHASILHFALVLNGQSFDLMRGEALSNNTGPTDPDPTHWAWRPTQESFIRARIVTNGTSIDPTQPEGTWGDHASSDTSYGRGGRVNSILQPRHIWQIWTKDGMRYEFREDLWWGWNKCDGGSAVEIEPYKWLLSTVMDPHGNIITYNYDRQTLTGGLLNCGAGRTGQGTVDRDAWPTEITWGGNINPSTGVRRTSDRYKVTFDSERRTTNGLPDPQRDMDWEGADNQYASIAGQPRETRRLKEILVWSMPGATWQLMRKYVLDNNHFDLYPDAPVCTANCTTMTPTFGPNTGYRKLTLLGIQQYGKDGTTPLPAVTFTYGTVNGIRVSPNMTPSNSTDYPTGPSGRLIRVENGQGGRVDFDYDSIGAQFSDLAIGGLFYNYRRVKSKTMRDGTSSGGCSASSPSTTCTWTYSYGTPNLNTLGTVRGGKGTQPTPNSAALYYNKFWDQYHDNSSKLVHRAYTEFRGHTYTLETDPTGVQTEHWFQQGDAGCVPYATGGGIINDACFQQLRDAEFLKGRERQTCVRTAALGAAPSIPCNPNAAGSKLMQETVHRFTVEFYDYGGNPALDDSRVQSGLWRAFAYEYQTEERAWEGAPTPKAKTTEFLYDIGYQYNAVTLALTGVQYGNLTLIKEYDGPITTQPPYRVTKHFFTSRNDATAYIVDRMAAERIEDHAGNLLTQKHQFFDDVVHPFGLGTRGLLRRTLNYYNLYDVPSPNILLGTDSTFTYDDYGNQITETSYAGPGQRNINANTWSAPGNGSSARTTTTAYDSAFNAFPTQVTYPSVGGVAALSESAGYDFQLGVMTSVTDLNSNTTSATYDMFGRMSMLVKPGDTPAAPTVQTSYINYTAGQPFRYEFTQQTAAGQLITRRYYDGIGRELQTRRGSVNSQDILVDMRYDGLGRVVAESQPRYVTAAGAYSAPGTPLFNQTAMVYDALGRPVQITTPDSPSNTLTTHKYGVVQDPSGAMRSWHNVVDGNRRRKEEQTDAFGRLTLVKEYTGTCSTNVQFWPEYPCGTGEPIWAVYASTSYTYNRLDLLTGLTDAQGNVTSMTYDSQKRKVIMNDPDMGAWSYLYDANGNLVQQTDAKAQVLWFGYDERNRLIQKRLNNAGGTLLASYGYDEAASDNGKGQRTSMSNTAVTVRWHYDSRARTKRADYSVIAALPGQTRSFQWTYDSADRIATIVYPNSETISYVYDVLGRPLYVQSTLDSNLRYANNAQFSALGQPLQWTFGNNALQTWTYTSPAQQLQQLRVGTSGTPGQFLNRSYTYDRVGNILSISDNAATPATTEYFDYDHLHRLTHSGPSSIPSLAMRPDTNLQRAGVSTKLFVPETELAASGTSWSAPLTADLAALLAQAPEHGAPLAGEPVLPQSTTPPAAPQAGELATLQASFPAMSFGPTESIASTTATQATPPAIDFARLPLAFIPNAGQIDSAAVRFLVRGVGGTLFFTPGEATLVLPPEDRDARAEDHLPATVPLTYTVVRLRYEGANAAPELRAGTQLPGVANYLTGDNPARWRSQLPTYAAISYEQLYSGIDLRYEGTDGQLKSTYVVAPGADPTHIRWRYTGARQAQIDPASGDLHIAVPVASVTLSATTLLTRTLIERAPIAWQEIGGARVPVAVRFEVHTDGAIGFALGTYDPAEPLIIDPILSYATYHGGSSTDEGNAITLDSSGAIYLAGATNSGGGTFPISAGAFQTSRAGGYDAYITKLNAAGSAIVYSTYLGGSGEDRALSLAVDSSGNAIVSGETESSNFPTLNAFDSSFGGGTCGSDPCDDAFVTKLNAAGSALVYSTFIGGSGEDDGNGVAVDSSGKIYVTGFTAGGLTTKSAYDSSYNGGDADVFVTKLDPALTGSNSHLFTSYLGGSDDDKGRGIAVDSTGSVYITGDSESNNFPVLNAYQGSRSGSSDVVVSKLTKPTSGNLQLNYSTYLGGSSTDEGTAIAVYTSGGTTTATITGYSRSSAFPTLNAWQSALEGERDVILARLNPALSGSASLLMSSYLGGTDREEGHALALDSTGNVALTGFTQSTDFPQLFSLRPTLGTGGCGTITCTDAFVVYFDMAHTTPIYSSLLGGTNDDAGRGIAFGSGGAVYVAGETVSSDFPTASPRQGSSGGGRDAFVAKLILPTLALSAASYNVSEGAGVANLTVNLSATSPQTVTIGYATSAGTAQAGSDYTSASGTLIIPPNQASATIAVPLANDPTDEPNETFALTLSSPANAILGTPVGATITIADDDAPPSVFWQSAAVSVGENAANALLTVELSAASSFTIMVAYATSNGTAIAGSDYTTTSGTLTFAPGETSRSASIPILNDTSAESNETINLTLSSPTNATIGTPNPATLTIIDNDSTPAPAHAHYTYDKIGNLLSKTDIGNYSYGTQSAACPAGALTKPHAVVSAGAATFCYDANGNLVNGGGRIYTWDSENRPLTIQHVSGTYTYTYDADGERVTTSNGSATTVYLGGLWEEVVGGSTKAYYTFNGNFVAMRAGSTVTYLHSDHLGSISLATGVSGGLPVVVSQQSFSPWGTVRSGGISQTTLNYTGQRFDTSGLLYYHARYYDPMIARFISPDTLVPDPDDPQGFNRYSYGMNNPIRYTDPSGHVVGPVRCHICGDWVDISGWSDTAKSMAVAGCFVLGCHVDLDRNMITGPTPQEWAEDSVTGLVPGAAVIKPGMKGPGKALREGSRFIGKIDTIINGQRVRRITSVLDKKVKTKLREEAVAIYDEINPGRRVAEGLEIHHRIPLEYAHLFPDADPNRFSNLVGLTRGVHDQIDARWSQLRRSLGGRIPTAAEIQQFAASLEKDFGQYYR